MSQDLIRGLWEADNEIYAGQRELLQENFQNEKQNIMGGNRTHVCSLCGTSKSDVTTAYLRVVKLKVGSRTGKAKWAYVKADSCDDCLKTVQRIKHRRYLVVAGMLLWMFLSPFVLLVLPALALPKGSPFTGPVLILGVILLAGGFIAGPIHIRRFNRREMPRVLGETWDAALRKLAGISCWGLHSEVLISRDTPPEPPVIFHV